MSVHLGYDLIRSRRRRRTISLQIKEGGRVVIRAPFHTPKWEIERFIEGKQSWIAEKLSEKEKQVKEAGKTFLPGEKFLFLGERYPLEICEPHHKESPLRLSFGNFILHQDSVEKARDLFVEWYKKEAKEKIAERINYYSRSVHLFPEGIRITSAKSRWGSCSQDNRLSFSWRIIMASLAVIDYILIHELVHIREKNHSAKFWATLESFLPDYRKHRLWLRENGHLLEL
ncbi:MAG TPA: SprT family zinc-dependent metalloprotease [Thermodesulfobacteriota bacterium]|nr:SprT family zinc-dependent metalloprotease [Thermodesulfobacteriota bacterium]